MKQPYICGAWFDNLLITTPGLICTLLVLAIPGLRQEATAMTDGQWVLLVLLVDVSHVYATLYRTYFDRQARQQFGSLFYLIPVLCFAAAFLLWNAGNPQLFWRILAYAAAFHFVRQQYGFCRLYSRNESGNKWSGRLDAAMVYGSTIAPLLWWHLSSSRNYNWFVEGDFLQADLPLLRQVLMLAYAAIAIVYLVKEIKLAANQGLNIPKNLLLLSTAASWYTGIVLLNSDLAFTLLNTISHGIPYMALVWVYARRSQRSNPNTYKRWVKATLYPMAFPLFLLAIALPGYLEEGFWDGLVWHEHQSVFPMFASLGHHTAAELRNLLIPLLIVPQLTHYVIDGFIWKVRKDKGLRGKLVG